MPTSRALALTLLLAVPSTLSAQRGVLDQAETRIANADLPGARALLERWRAEHPAAEPEDIARYHMLSARLTSDADAAEDQYLMIAVTYPTARVAPEALLRLAQARYARGDSAQALQYLERLIADYPNSDHRTLGAAWLVRARGRSANKAELCATVRGVEAGTNPETVQYFRTEVTRYCGTSAPAPRATAQQPRAIRDTTARLQPPRDTTAAVPSPTRPPRAAPATPATPAGRLTIQAGAFRELSGAQSVKRQLERAGFTDVRLVRVPGNQLIRVRIGKFADRAAASGVLARLARADISAVLVSDAHTETPVKD